MEKSGPFSLGDYDLNLISFSPICTLENSSRSQQKQNLHRLLWPAGKKQKNNYRMISPAEPSHHCTSYQHKQLHPFNEKMMFYLWLQRKRGEILEKKLDSYKHLDLKQFSLFSFFFLNPFICIINCTITLIFIVPYVPTSFVLYLWGSFTSLG